MKDLFRRRRSGEATALTPVVFPEAPTTAMVTDQPPFIGYIDKIGAGNVIGWAARRGQSEPIQIELLIDGELAAKSIASDERQDVAEAGYGKGTHGFNLPVAKRQLLPARELAIRVGGESGVIVHRTSLVGESHRSSPVVFLDASDLLEFLTYHREVSGIQRVQAGYLVGLENETLEGYEFRVCARFRDHLHYMEVPFAGLAALLRDAGDKDAVANESWRDHVNAFRHALPTRVAFAKGDVLFTMGAPWATENHNEAVRSAVRTSGALYFQIFYDLIPITMPEVVAFDLIPIFSRAMAAMMIYCNHVFSISAFSKADLERAGERLGHKAPPVSLIPMGGTIDDADHKRAEATSAAVPIVEGDFVLCVGTIEPRKNHNLLYQVWKRLIETHGADAVPKLVLVGRIGWYMEDFLRFLKTSNYLDGKVVLLQNISNEELGSLYDSCLFTTFPSIYEGWGLPIGESMARGKVCVCSNVTSMPEAGGDCAIYIDPYSISEAFKTFETLILDHEALASAQEKVRTDFHSPTWMEAARVFRTALGQALREAVPARAADPLDGRRLTRLGHLYDLGQAASKAGAMKAFEHGIEREEALDLLAGCAWFDPDVHCSWAVGPVAKLQLALSPDTSGKLAIYCEVMAPPLYIGRRCIVRFDGRQVASYLFEDGTPKKLLLMVEASNDVEPSRFHELQFDFGALRFPPAGAPDKRLLGLGVSWLAVLDKEDLQSRIAFTESEYSRNWV